MTLKLVTRSMFVVGAFFVAVACVFSLVVAYTPALSGAPIDPGEPSPALARGISAVPHSVTEERFVNCANCHAIGARRGMPQNHRTFVNENCSLCHAYPQAPEQALRTMTAAVKANRSD